MIPVAQKPKVISNDGREAVIEIDGLYPGYGMTLGTALRRILLSSCEGAAITSFRINNAPHEFSTLPYIAEDLVEISLNLKKIRFKAFSEEPQTLSLNVKGIKEIKAKDFAKNSQVEIINPEVVIANINDKKGSFELEVKVEKGIGYSMVDDRRRKEKLPIGMIEIDANFSPVILVNLDVENMRVGEKTNFNRLRLHIKTDGSVDPLAAFDDALGILEEQAASLRTLAEENEEGPKSFSELRDGSEVGETDLEGIAISGRVLAVLKQHRLKTLGDLEKAGLSKISGFKGLGDKAVEEIKKAAKKYGIVLE